MIRGMIKGGKGMNGKQRQTIIYEDGTRITDKKRGARWGGKTGERPQTSLMGTTEGGQGQGGVLAPAGHRTMSEKLGTKGPKVPGGSPSLARDGQQGQRGVGDGPGTGGRPFAVGVASKEPQPSRRRIWPTPFRMTGTGAHGGGRRG